MPAFNASTWIRISFASLLLVALLGVVMRYKIGFSFPLFNQKHLQHAHSHFAFAGWVSQTLMVFMVQLLRQSLSQARMRRYQGTLWANILAAGGMLLAFGMQGYGLYSITLSTLAIFNSFYFTSLFIPDLRKCKIIMQPQWFVAALICNILSTLGTFALAWMMATKDVPQHPYLASVYWFLHFQYNGWFFFACMGLFIQHLWSQYQVTPSIRIFWLFAVSCLPAYGLSTLWLQLPAWVYALVVAASLAQFTAWVLFLLGSAAKTMAQEARGLTRYLLIYLAVAATLKFSLQLGSVVPAVSQLAFGFRPIVIAYLHLVLLAITTVFLIAFSYMQQLLPANRFTHTAIGVFVAAVFLNEAALAVQGIASFSYTLVPAINETLLGIALLLLMAVIMLCKAAWENTGHPGSYDYNHKA